MGYKIVSSGNFLTISGIAGTPTEGELESVHKTLIKRVRQSSAKEALILIDVDNNTLEFAFAETQDSDGNFYTSIAAFYTAMLAALNDISCS